MASLKKGHLMMNAARFVAISMLATMLTTGCPIPVQYPLEPEEENEPPVINATYTVPYVVMEDPVDENATPELIIVVDDPNAGDDLKVKVIRNPQTVWLTDGQHDVLLEEHIEPLDTLPPEDASNMGVSETTRRAALELQRTPCEEGKGGSEANLLVCITDRSWDPPPSGHPNDPCIPRDGFVDKYTVVVTCAVP